jgi:hypothetical protein
MGEIKTDAENITRLGDLMSEGKILCVANM